MPDTETERWRRFTIVTVTEGQEPLSVGFKVYRSVRVAEDEPLYRVSHNGLPIDETSDIVKADVFAGGNISWDGCSNMDIGHVHFCDPEEAVELGDLLRYVYAIAHRRIIRPDFDVTEE